MKSRLVAMKALLLLAGMLLGSCVPATGAPPPTATTAPVAPVTPTVAYPPAPEFIEIGGSIPLTGKFGSRGVQVLAGYQYAVEDINAAGGVYVAEYGTSIPFRLTYYDDESDPTKAVQNMETPYSDLDVCGLHGRRGKADARGNHRHRREEQGPVSPHLLCLAEHPPARLPVPVLAVSHVARSGARSIPGSHRDNPEAWTAHQCCHLPGEHGLGHRAGRNAPGERPPCRLQRGVCTQDHRLLQHDPGCPGRERGHAPQHARHTIWHHYDAQSQRARLDTQVRPARPGAGCDHQGETLGKLSDSVAFFPGWHYGEMFPGVAELNPGHEADLGRSADVLVRLAYACVQVLADAIESAGMLGREAIREAPADTKMMTLIGPVSFNADATGNVLNPLIMWINGQQELIWQAIAAPIALPQATPSPQTAANPRLRHPDCWGPVRCDAVGAGCR